MSILYLAEQGAKIKKTGRRLVVTKEDKELAEIQCLRLDSIQIFGNVQISTQALASLLYNGIDLTFMTINGKLKGTIVSPKSKNIILRHQQFSKTESQEWCLSVAKKVIKLKINSCIVWIESQEKNFGPINGGRVRNDLKNYKLLVDKSLSVDSLRGIEGVAARVHFSAFNTLNKSEFTWTGRNKRPPKDPINAMLSFGYSILTNRIHSALEGSGLDPYLGFYHKIRYGMPSLALDMLEIFRHEIVDSYVIKSVNLGKYKTRHFTERNGGVFFDEVVIKRFLYDWEKHLTKIDFQNKLNKEISRLIRIIMEGSIYSEGN